MRRWLTLVAALALSAAGLMAPAAAQAAGPYCGITWGSVDKHTAGPAGATGSSLVTGVRAGQHACYDRFVIDLSGRVPDAAVGYVPVFYSGSGGAIPLRGGAILQVTVTGLAMGADLGRPDFTPADPDELVAVPGYRTLRQVAREGAFEGFDSYGAGVRARLPFRVAVLAGPGSGSRLVVDVAHHW